LTSWDQYGGKKFPTGPLFIRARELLLLFLVTVASNLVEAWVGRRRMSSELNVTENYNSIYPQPRSLLLKEKDGALCDAHLFFMQM
jgi:hypothetical protein